MATPATSSDGPQKTVPTLSPSPARAQVGKLAPEFTLPDPVTGDAVSLRSQMGRDVLLVFLRGTWCPFCREQLRLLTEWHDRLNACGISVLAVVCQGRSAVRRYLSQNPLPFPLLCDESRGVARAYGTHYWLRYEGFNLSHPALFILDRKQIVTFQHVGRNMHDLPVTFVLDKFCTLLEKQP